MWDQEKEHLKKFEQIVTERRVRPTVLVPLWDVAGYVLGRYSENKYLVASRYLVLTCVN